MSGFQTDFFQTIPQIGNWPMGWTTLQLKIFRIVLNNNNIFNEGLACVCESLLIMVGGDFVAVFVMASLWCCAGKCGFINN